jgi:RHS repeat-associated protein
VQTEGAVTLNISNSYMASGLLEQTTTPSGQTIDYVWHNDRLEAIDINGQPLISQIVYESDGQIGAWTWSNGTTSERVYDLAGRPVAISLGFDTHSQWPTQRTYSYDAASRITGITDDIDHELDQIFGYDGLDRLITSQKGAATLSTSDYTYDLSGNRISKILNNSLIETHSIDFGSNRLQQKIGVQTVNYSYDPAGNLLSDGTTNYSYNAQGRRISATATNLNATYSYNPLGQRVSKTVNGTTTRFVYDQQGHLLGEYNATGQLIQEIVWLGDLPIAILKPNAAESTLIDVFYIHSDHLVTPRKITRPSDNKAVWTWESEAFGNTLPNQNPDNLGSFVFNLRFPGQYYDLETGLHYNVFRDYDPDNGRYIESDLIGLAGGINTYSYVGENPVNWIDPLGLDSCYAVVGRIVCVTGQRLGLSPDYPSSTTDEAQPLQCETDHCATLRDNIINQTCKSIRSIKKRIACYAAAQLTYLACLAGK